MTKKTTLSIAAFITAVWAMLARHQEATTLFQVLKPLTTILIMVIAFLSINPDNKTYSRRLIAALGFCLLGDVLLLEENYFLFGLAAFFIAHLVFTFAFSQVMGFYKNLLPLFLLVIICGTCFLYLQPGLGALTLPVAAYMTVLIVMNWQAIGLFLRQRQHPYLLLAVGALLFTLSDSLLALAKFKAPFPLADVSILTTYWLAIYLFAYSSFFVKNATA